MKVAQTHNLKKEKECDQNEWIYVVMKLNIVITPRTHRRHFIRTFEAEKLEKALYCNFYGKTELIAGFAVYKHVSKIICGDRSHS